MDKDFSFNLDDGSVFLKKETYKSYIVFYSDRYNALRVVYRDDRWMFIASDICEGLKYTKISYLLEKIDKSQKSVVDFYYCDQFDKPQFFHAVSFEGLLSMAEQSSKDDAAEYVSYVRDEILPSLRELEESGECILSFRNDKILWVNSLKDIQFYKNKKFDRIRFTQYDDEILFVAKDVAEIAGHTHANRAVYNHCTNIRYVCVQTSGLSHTSSGNFLKREDSATLPENFFPDTQTDDGIIAEEDSFTSPAEVRGLKLIPIQDVCRLIARSRMPSATQLLDSIISEFIASHCFAKQAPAFDTEKKAVEAEKLETEESSAITEKEVATAWRLIEKYLRSKSSIDRDILLFYDHGMTALRRCSPLQLFGVNIEMIEEAQESKPKEKRETKKEPKKSVGKISNLSDIDILPYIEDMFIQDSKGLTYNFIYTHTLHKENGQEISCFDEFLERIARKNGVSIKITRNKVTRYLKEIGFTQTHTKMGNGVTINKVVYEKVKANQAKRYAAA